MLQRDKLQGQKIIKSLSTSIDFPESPGKGENNYLLITTLDTPKWRN